MEPEQLVLLKKQNTKAQEEFYLSHARRMFALALRYLGNEFDASSVVNLAFLKAFSRIASFQYKGNGSLEAWLRKIVVNEALMHLRGNKKDQLLMGIDGFENKIENPPTSPLEETDLLNMLRSLPAGYRTVFNLYAIEGFNHDEIGAQLGITAETSRSQLSRARALLKGMLENE